MIPNELFNEPKNGYLVACEIFDRFDGSSELAVLMSRIDGETP